jgi:Uma2 family endonuclease
MTSLLTSPATAAGTNSIKMIVLDRDVAAKFIRQRHDTGNDRWDEVWDGVYIVMPNPNIEHQDIATGLATVLRVVIDWAGLGKVYQGVNVSDRSDDWTKNYRCPDVAIYLKENPSEPRGAFWFGGPDFAVEIVSPDDRSREKLDFYAKVGVRELLLVDRDPWAIELYQRQGSELIRSHTSTPEQSSSVKSAVLSVTFRMVAGPERPSIEIVHDDGVQRWNV